MKRIKKALCFVLALALLPIGALLVGCGKKPALALDTSDAKIYYNLGEDFSSEGLVVEYNDGKTTSEVDDFDIDSSAFSKTETGEYTIKIEYADIEKTYKVYVVTLSVDATNAQTTFVVGDTFSPAGLVVKATTDEENVLSAEDYVVDTTGLDMQVAGTKTVKVIYNGIEATYQVQVKQLSEIVNEAIENKEDIKSVTQNMSFESTSNESGMEVVVLSYSKYIVSGTQNYMQVSASTTMGTTVIAVESEQWQTQGGTLKEKATMFGMTAYTEYTDTVEDFQTVEDLTNQMFGYVTLEDVEDVSYTVVENILTVSYTIPADSNSGTPSSDVVLKINLNDNVITEISVTSLSFSEDGETPGTVSATLSTELAEVPELPIGVNWEPDLYYEEEGDLGGDVSTGV